MQTSVKSLLEIHKTWTSAWLLINVTTIRRPSERFMFPVRTEEERSRQTAAICLQQQLISSLNAEVDLLLMHLFLLPST